jgi:hypothetical protein
MYVMASGNLKGSDATLLRVCRSLNLSVSPRVLYKSDDWENDYYLCTSYADIGFYQDSNTYFAETGAEKIGHCHYSESNLKECSYCEHEKTTLEEDTIRWVSTPNEKNAVKSDYVAYGNEAELACVYGNLVLVVDARAGKE